MKVSILVPVYGVEKYIERCAVSLFEQTYKNIEYIFVNDQSPDSSWGVLQDVIARYPYLKDCVKLSIHDKNRGLAAVRNTALSLAAGDFVMWVDSDDYIETNAVEKCVSVVEAENPDIVLFNYRIEKGSYSEIVKVRHFENPLKRTVALLARKVPACVWCGIIRRSLYVDHNIKSKEGINNSEDFHVTPKLSFFSQKISYIDSVLYHYDCTREDTYTRNFSIEKSEQVFMSFEILEDFFKTKESIYMDALMRGKMKFMIGELVASSDADDNSYFIKISRMIDSMNRNSLKGLGLLEYLFYYVRLPIFIKYVMKFLRIIKAGILMLTKYMNSK